MEHFAGVDTRRKQQQTDGDGHAGPKDEALHYVGPDDGFEAADEGVEDGDEAEDDDDAGQAPAGNAADRERQ